MIRTIFGIFGSKTYLNILFGSTSDLPEIQSVFHSIGCTCNQLTFVGNQPDLSIITPGHIETLFLHVSLQHLS